VSILGQPWLAVAVADGAVRRADELLDSRRNAPLGRGCSFEADPWIE